MARNNRWRRGLRRNRARANRSSTGLVALFPSTFGSGAVFFRVVVDFGEFFFTNLNAVRAASSFRSARQCNRD